MENGNNERNSWVPGCASWVSNWKVWSSLFHLSNKWIRPIDSLTKRGRRLVIFCKIFGNIKFCHLLESTTGACISLVIRSLLSYSKLQILSENVTNFKLLPTYISDRFLDESRLPFGRYWIFFICWCYALAPFYLQIQSATRNKWRIGMEKNSRGTILHLKNIWILIYSHFHKLQILKVVLINQTIVLWPLVYIGYRARQLRPQPDIYTLPPFGEFFFQILFSIVADDVGYYVLHR